MFNAGNQKLAVSKVFYGSPVRVVWGTSRKRGRSRFGPLESTTASLVNTEESETDMRQNGEF